MNGYQSLVAEPTKAMRVWQTSLSEPKLERARNARIRSRSRGTAGHRAGERASALAVAAIEQFTLIVQLVFRIRRHRSEEVLAQLHLCSVK